MDKVIILVVSPNAEMLEAARSIGASTGLEYITCKNTAEAIELVEREQVDLIAAEAYMEDDDVFSLIKAVRALPRQLQKPIWIFAADPGPIGTQLSPQTAVAAQLLGADRFDVAHVEDIPRLVAETRAVIEEANQRLKQKRPRKNAS